MGQWAGSFDMQRRGRHLYPGDDHESGSLDRVSDTQMKGSPPDIHLEYGVSARPAPTPPTQAPVVSW